MGRAGQIGALLAGAIVLGLVLAQLLLPGIAASRIRSRVGRYGTVESVTVKAWPAVELLWGHVDSVDVKAGSLRLTPAQTAKLLGETRGVQTMRLTAESVKEGSLQLRDASLRKHGDALVGEAFAAQADVQAALGKGVKVKLLRSGGGQVEVSVNGGLFGVRASVDAIARAQEGKLVVHPLGFLLEGLKLTLISAPHVYVEGVSASAATEPPGAVAGYKLRVWGSLR